MAVKTQDEMYKENISALEKEFDDDFNEMDRGESPLNKVGARKAAFQGTLAALSAWESRNK